jgi:hypothetical protein
MSLIIANLKRMRACEEKSKGELGEKGVPGCTTKTCRGNMGKEKREEKPDIPLGWYI